MVWLVLYRQLETRVSGRRSKCCKSRRETWAYLYPQVQAKHECNCQAVDGQNWDSHGSTPGPRPVSCHIRAYRTSSVHGAASHVELLFSSNEFIFHRGEVQRRLARRPMTAPNPPPSDVVARTPGSLEPGPPSFLHPSFSSFLLSIRHRTPHHGDDGNRQSPGGQIFLLYRYCAEEDPGAGAGNPQG